MSVEYLTITTEANLLNYIFLCLNTFIQFLLFIDGKYFLSIIYC